MIMYDGGDSDYFHVNVERYNDGDDDRGVYVDGDGSITVTAAGSMVIDDDHGKVDDNE